MKKHLIVVLLLLAGGFAFGQKGEIVYTEYEPPVYVHYIGSDGVYDTIYFDIDHNGISEFRIEAERGWGFQVELVLRRNDWYAHHEDWRVRIPYDVFDPNDFPLTDTIHFGDTISNIPEETWYKAYRFYYYNPGVPTNISPDDHIYLSFRKATE